MQQSQAMDIRPVRRKPAVAMKPKAAVPATAKRLNNPTVPENKPRRPSSLKAFIKRLQSHPLRQHPYIIPVTVFVVMSFLAMATLVVNGGKTVGASDTRIITLAYDGKEQIIPTRASSVKAFLEELNIQVSEKDIVEPSLDTEIFIGERQKVVVHKARSVKVIDGKNVITIVSAEPSAREVAEKAGLAVYPEDKIQTATDVIEIADILKEGIVAETIVIDRATPIKLNLFGTTYEVRTHAETVGELAKEKGFEFASSFPSADTPLQMDQSVFITDADKKITVTEELIDFTTDTIDDRNLERGATVVREPGKPGKKAVIYEISEDGSRKPLQEVIIQHPVKKVIAVGKKLINRNVSQQKQEIMLAAGISPEDFSYVDFIITKESGWNLAARNAGGCLGLGQACPGSKLINVCPNYDTDAVCQMKFFNGYAQTCASWRPYCGWEGAYTFWTLKHWW